jgi:glycosyltransferase involved in cell wall biosynthesis
MTASNILLFADRLPPLIGGMEMHAGYFIEYFTDHPKYPLSGVITKDCEGEDYLLSHGLINIHDLPNLFDPTVIFFNSGRWIEEFEVIRKIFPGAIFIYRTGGNEIIKAPLIRNQISDHAFRQAYWVETLNRTIDLLITNSDFTERRLRDVGIACPFSCLVGGVNAAALRPSTATDNSNKITIFCGARFVPYKNHLLLLSVIQQLILRGLQLSLRLAGDGPLLERAREQVTKDKLTSVVEFLGVLDNERTCQEISGAHIYMQLSEDTFTEVLGGSYIHSECMGRSILEALTAGTFIIAGKSGALQEIVAQGQGVLVEFDDLERMTDKIELAIKNIPPRPPFSDQYCWSKLFYRYEQLMRNLDENIGRDRKV